MALLKSQEARELQELQHIERQIKRSERRERVHHILIAGLGALLVASVLTGHLGLCKKCRR